MLFATYHLWADGHARKQRVRGEGEWIFSLEGGWGVLALEKLRVVNWRNCSAAPCFRNKTSISSHVQGPRYSSHSEWHTLHRNARPNRSVCELARHTAHLTSGLFLWPARTPSNACVDKPSNWEDFLFIGLTGGKLSDCDGIVTISPDESDELDSSEASPANITALLRPHSG